MRRTFDFPFLCCYSNRFSIDLLNSGLALSGLGLVYGGPHLSLGWEGGLKPPLHSEVGSIFVAPFGGQGFLVEDDRGGEQRRHRPPEHESKFERELRHAEIG